MTEPAEWMSRARVRSRRRARLTWLFACVAMSWVLGGAIAHADGALPPLPYRYLHPPPALAQNNEPPLSRRLVIRMLVGSSPRIQTFTHDGQVGVTANTGAIRLSPGKSLEISIRPVETPPGLPGLYVVDGNAYDIALTTQPGNGTPTIIKPFNVIMRWPHIPTAIYAYTGGAWRRICYSDQGVLAGFTLSCKSATSPGVYAAVAPPSTTVITTPNTPIAHSRFAWLDPYIPILAAAALLLATTILLYFVVWPRRGKDVEA